MTQYCLIENSEITDGPRTLPKSWRNISGLDLLDDALLKLRGWVPYANTKPAYNADTQHLTSEKVISATTVVETYTVNDYTEAEMTTRIAAAKLARKTAIRLEAQNIIFAEYPLWYQANVANRIYDAGTMLTEIAAYIVISNTNEDLVDVCTTLAEIRAISPVWNPEVE